MNKQNLLITSSGQPNIDRTIFEVVERKGIGHPDTLCDTLSEKISQAYSQYCLKNYGIILRHMVDKIALSGGSSKVMFGGGQMQKPIRLYLNCRFTRTFNGKEVPYMKIVKEVVYAHLGKILPLLDLDKWLLIVDNTHFSQGPGVVYDSDGTTKNERQFFFEVPDKNYAAFHDNCKLSNDTSTTVAYSPLSSTEKIVLLIERHLNSDSFKILHPYVGTDIKVMAMRVKEKLDITVCVPFISVHTPNQEFYFEKLQYLAQKIKDLVLLNYGLYEVNVFLNTRDNPSKSDFYLTLTGSAIESGDEGVVGRGNRYNGIIPFTRHMTLEACCGKNPVYHVGKLYTVICDQISTEIYEKLKLETYVYMTSQMGRDLNDPWFTCIEACGREVKAADEDEIRTIIHRNLANASETTIKIVKGEINLFL